MTIRELYAWAEEHDAVDCEIEIQHRDAGGYYRETDDLREEEIVIEDEDYGKVVIL